MGSFKKANYQCLRTKCITIRGPILTCNFSMHIIDLCIANLCLPMHSVCLQTYAQTF